MKFPIRVSPLATPEFWRDVSDYGDLSSKFESNYLNALVANDTKIWVSAPHPASNFGRTANGMYVACYNTSGTLLWDMSVNDQADSATLKSAIAVPNLALNPFDTDHTLVCWESGDPVLTFLDENGAEDYAVQLNMNAVGFIGFCSNGDVWAVNNQADGASAGTVSNHNDVMLLDRSAGTPYQTILYQRRIGLSNVNVYADPVDQGGIDFGCYCINTDDSLIMAGREVVDYNTTSSTDNERKCAVVKITTGGVITATRLFESSLFDVERYPYQHAITNDSSGNIYLLHSLKPTGSLSAEDYPVYLTKLNSSLVEQWTMKTTTWSAPVISNNGYSIAISPDGLKVYAAWGGNAGDLEFFIFNASTGAYIDHGVLTGLAAEAYPFTFYFAKLVCNATRVIISGLYNGNYYLRGFSILSTNQEDFEKGGTFDDVRILYDRVRSNVYSNSLRSKDAITWSAIDLTEEASAVANSATTFTAISGSSAVASTAITSPAVTHSFIQK